MLRVTIIFISERNNWFYALNVVVTGAPGSIRLNMQESCREHQNIITLRLLFCNEDSPKVKFTRET